jgi:adenylylsulfate kinase-like enzyme
MAISTVGLERLVDQLYEVPESPDLHLLAGGEEPDALAERVVQHLLTSEIVK